MKSLVGSLQSFIGWIFYLCLLSRFYESRATSTAFVYQDLYSFPPHRLLFSKKPPHDINSYQSLVVPLYEPTNTFLCKIPSPLAPIQPTTESVSPPFSVDEQVTKAVASLTPMSAQCLHLFKDWWTYEFCYNKHVRQFHLLSEQEKRELAQLSLTDRKQKEKEYEYILGTYSELPRQDNAPKYELISDGQGAQETVNALGPPSPKAYLRQKWGLGTWCDLAQRERDIEIQYYCHPNIEDHIALIKETSTCSYLVVINTWRLCNQVAFTPKLVDDTLDIVCYDTRDMDVKKSIHSNIIDDLTTVKTAAELLSPLSQEHQQMTAQVEQPGEKEASNHQQETPNNQQETARIMEEEEDNIQNDPIVQNVFNELRKNGVSEAELDKMIKDAKHMAKKLVSQDAIPQDPQELANMLMNGDGALAESIMEMMKDLKNPAEEDDEDVAMVVIGQDGQPKHIPLNKKKKGKSSTPEPHETPVPLPDQPVAPV